MAGQRWFHKLRRSRFTTTSSSHGQPKSAKTPSKLISSIYYRYSSSSSSSSIGVLAFDVAGMASKLIFLHASLSDKSIIRLKNESIALEGVRKIVSNDDDFLLGLACAEMLQSLRLVSGSLATNLCQRCRDPNLRCFLEAFDDFAERGRDPYNWVLSSKELESLTKKLDRQITATSDLYREMEELSRLENSLHRKSNNNKPAETAGNTFSLLGGGSDHHRQSILDVQQKIVWQKQQVKFAKEKSLWTRSFDSVTQTLARLVFTVLARIKLLFGIGHGFIATSFPRSLSANSALVFPSQDLRVCCEASEFISGPLRLSETRDHDEEKIKKKMDSSDGGRTDFFECHTKVLNPPPGTLGASALALHYANLIVVLEKMVKSPQLVGLDARDDLYSMLPNSIRSSLRSRLRGVGFSAADQVLAGEWRDALGRILGWLSPLAHNMIKWQSERSFDQRNRQNQHLRRVGARANVFLLQTLYFANRDKAEAAIAELLVGLNYIWRFDREMNAKALFECSSLLHLHGSSS